MHRRDFLKATLTGAAAMPFAGCIARPLPVRSPNASMIPDAEDATVVNDVHSQLNETRVAAIVKPRNVDELREALLVARREGRAVAIAGGRHAMGGQQFADRALLVDTRALNRVLGFDDEHGTIDAEGGIQWPALLEYLEHNQPPHGPQWGIYQKQTGADRLSLAGALACNAHGRALTLKPIVQQVEEFDLLGPDGELRTCSRDANRDLFRIAIGGYGMFGIITRVRLKLRPRVKVRRVVELARIEGIIERFEQRIRDGYLYGDFQFATDATRDSFLARGVFSCYEPMPDDTPLTVNPTRFHPEDWARLTFYAHAYKTRAFDTYSTRYLQTSGQIYWHDWQLSGAYVDNYHADVDRALGSEIKATEMITEVYVARPQLARFMAEAATLLRRRQANVIYGTVRMIERDDETFMPWARDRYACIVFNLHIEHTPRHVEDTANAFRDLIDLAIAHDGSYYLTYHRWARKDQVLRCYPEMPDWLARKRAYDPGDLWQSSWYRHYCQMMQ